MIACRCCSSYIFAREERKKCATLCIPDNRYLVFIELVARVRISCGMRTACPFSTIFSTPPPPPRVPRFFYRLLAFVYLKLHNVPCHTCDNIERLHILYFFTIKDYEKDFSSVVVLCNLLSSLFRGTLKGYFYP